MTHVRISTSREAVAKCVQPTVHARLPLAKPASSRLAAALASHARTSSSKEVGVLPVTQQGFAHPSSVKMASSRTTASAPSAVMNVLRMNGNASNARPARTEIALPAQLLGASVSSAMLMAPAKLALSIATTAFS